MQKLPAKKTLLILDAIAILGLITYFGIALYSATTAEEQLTAATITAADLSPYLTGIVQIACNDTSGGDGGSGSLWNIPKLGYTILTNEHVIEDDGNGSRNLGAPGGFDANDKPITIKHACAVSLDGSDEKAVYYIDLAGKHQWNAQADTADLPIQFNVGGYNPTSSTPPVADLNYAISSLKLCPASMPIGSPVVIIGFPSYADATTTTEDGTATHNSEIATTGIVSGFTWSDIITGATLQYPDFFTTALMDDGNSGGIALAKDTNGLCVLGIPTFISQGYVNAAGVIQNIRNVFQLD